MLVLSNVSTLYDGRGSSSSNLLRGIDVLIDGDRIDAVEPHQAGRVIDEKDAKVDCTGKTVTPGLIDCHGHISVLGLAQADMEAMLQPAALLYVEKILHRTLIDGGVTTLRDVGGATNLMKRMVDDGLMIGPRLKISICMLSTTGGHADFRGPDRCHATVSKLWPEGPGRPPSIVDGPWDCRKRVREIAACGADLIKICTSPGVASPSDHLEHQDFSPEEVLAICDEAEARGLRVAAHAHSQAGIELAIRSGVHDLQHISFMDERLVEMAHAHGCTVTPTSWITNELQNAAGLSDFVMEKVKQVAEVHQKAVEFSAKGGLRILAGTDAVLPGMHGKNFLEIAHLIRDGLNPLHAWHAMTGLAAAGIAADDTGEVVAGKRADLLVCNDGVIDHPATLGEGALLEVLKDGVGHRGWDRVPQRAFGDTVAAALGK